MLRQRVAWREAALVFLYSRVVIVFITIAALMSLPYRDGRRSLNCVDNIYECLHGWYHWDSIAYASIAQYGYRTLKATAFFPLFPALQHGLGVVLGGSSDSYYYAGLILANLCFYLALVFLYSLVSQDFTASIARNTLYYIAFCPYGIFFFLGYTEALFLLVTVATFYFLSRNERRRSWWLAGLCGFFAVLTRGTGIVLVVPFVFLVVQQWWRRRDNASVQRSWFQYRLTSQDTASASDSSNAESAELTPRRGRGEMHWRWLISVALPVLLIPAGVVAYMLYLQISTGHALAFSVEETQSWHRPLSWPWLGTVLALQHIFNNDHLLANCLDLIFVWGSIAVLSLGCRSLPWHYRLYALCMVLFSLSYPQMAAAPLTAGPRYMAVIFPLFVILARWGKYEQFDRVYVAFSVAFFALNVILFVLHYWVA